MKPPTTHKFVLLSLLAASSFGCASDHDPGAHVQSFRVLAVQADAPYAHPGEDVSFSALSHDPQGRSIDWGWGVCPSPLGSTTSACLDQFREIVAQQGDAAWLLAGPDEDSALVNIPADFLALLPAEARPQAQIGVVSAACPGTLSLDADAPQVPFRCTDPDGRALALDEYVVGVKRVNVRQSDRNQNPVIAGVEFDGADWPEDEVKEVSACSTSDYDYEGCPDGAKHHIAAILDPGSFETGVDEHQRDFSEQLVIQHYATEGIFESEIRVAGDPKNGWVARRSAAGSEVRMWLVARDDRGGVSWTERRVRVRQ